MPTPRPNQPADPAARPGGILCPYCGHVSADPRRCDSCSGYFDPLSRQASQNAMGPWFIRDPHQPFRPGCSYETLKELIRRKKINRSTVLRGPSTRQFWSFAGRTPSVANLLGVCHNCQAEVDANAFACHACGAAFTPDTDRQHLGLAPVHLLPGQASPEIIAATAAANASGNSADDGAAGSAGKVEERGERNTGAWVVGGGAAGVAIALCTGAVIWALRVPVAEAPRATPIVEAAAVKEPEVEALQTLAAAAEGEEERGLEEEVTAAPEEPPVVSVRELFEEFREGAGDLAVLRQRIEELEEQGVLDDEEAQQWLALVEMRERLEQLRQLP